MNKYEILEGKLTAINAYIDTMCLLGVFQIMMSFVPMILFGN